MTGLIYGKNEISAYLNNASDYLLKKWVREGMPVLIEDGPNGRWLAHKENLEDFFRHYTRRRAKAEMMEDEK